MIKATLNRICSDNDQTFGVLTIGSTPICVTLELPWRNNERNISRIPEGEYICRLVDSPSFGKTFQICDVPDRGHILFHKGNFSVDSRGCVLLGCEFGVNMVSESKKAFNNFMNYFTEDFELEIINC